MVLFLYWQLIFHIVKSLADEGFIHDGNFYTQSATDLSKYVVDEPELQMVASSLYGNALAGVRAAIAVPTSSGMLFVFLP